MLTILHRIEQAIENPPVKIWEYKTVRINYMERSNLERSKRSPETKISYRKNPPKPLQRYFPTDLSILNEHGKDGWELCGVNGVNYYLKREIRE